MKYFWTLLLLIFFAASSSFSQGNGLPKQKNRLLLSAGLRAPTNFPAVYNLRIGIDYHRSTFFLGVHRVIDFRVTKPSLYIGRNFIHYPLGLNFVYRYTFSGEKERLSTFFLASFFGSMKKAVQDPRYHQDPKTLGNWVYFEPNIGYGAKFKLTSYLSLSLEAGTGLIIYNFFSIPPSQNDWGWPAQFSGSVLLEKRF